MFSILLLYLYNLCMLFTCGGNKEYYCLGECNKSQVLAVTFTNELSQKRPFDYDLMEFGIHINIDTMPF